MRNLAFVLSYDGTDFNGWQTQPGFRTVQETLEAALSDFIGMKIKATASGRTDSGVHAVGQVANFHTETEYSPETFLRAVNVRLPLDVVVQKCWEADETFCANRSAKRKLYRYVIHDAETPDPFLRRYCYHFRCELDAAAMHRACQCLMGRHDFHSFETEWPNRATSIRTITHIAVNRMGDYLWLDVEADGFLYNMVRAIAGTLIDVGRGYRDEIAVANILAAQDRTLAGPTAPAQGLFLMRVTY